MGRGKGSATVRNGSTLVVKGIVPYASEEDVRGYFEKYGEILGVRLYDVYDGERLAQVEFAVEEEAENARVMTNGTKLRNRKIQVGKPRGRKKD
jgi:RNA recognition motif-containing protein